MAVDMEKLKGENPEAHAYILELRGEAAGHRTDATEWKSKYVALEPQVTSLQTERDALATKAATLETDVRTAQVETWRTAAAKVHGLTDAQAKRLQGNTDAEFLADAEAFAKDLPAPKKTTAPPDPSLRQPDPSGDGSDVTAEAKAMGDKLLGMLGATDN